MTLADYLIYDHLGLRSVGENYYTGISLDFAIGDIIIFLPPQVLLLLFTLLTFIDRFRRLIDRFRRLL